MTGERWTEAEREAIRRLDEAEAEITRRLGPEARLRHWIIEPDGRTVRPASWGEWSVWFERAYGTDVRRVATTEREGWTVSTVFLGIDHNWAGGPPHIFETMVFSDWPWLDKWTERWSTWDQAEHGHELIVEAVERFSAELRDAGIEPSTATEEQAGAVFGGFGIEWGER